MNHINITIDGYNSRLYITKTIDNLGREVCTYWVSGSTVPVRQDIYNPRTGEYTYLLGGCIAQ